jgi:hypothetical protein
MGPDSVAGVRAGGPERILASCMLGSVIHILIRPASSRVLVWGPMLLCSAVALAFQPQAAAAQKPESAKEPKNETVVLRACIAGPTLTEVSAEPGGRGSGQTYRIAGPRELVKQIKRDHAGHYDEVTGRIKGEFAPPNGRRVGTVGKVGIVIGAGPAGGAPNVPRVPEMPSFEVRSLLHLDDHCPR